MHDFHKSNASHHAIAALAKQVLFWQAVNYVGCRKICRIVSIINSRALFGTKNYKSSDTSVLFCSLSLMNHNEKTIDNPCKVSTAIRKFCWTHTFLKYLIHIFQKPILEMFRALLVHGKDSSTTATRS